MKRSFQYLILTLSAGVLLLALNPTEAVAQDPSPSLTETEESQRTKDYGRSGYPRVRIYLWGNANNGVWTVEEGTSLLEFLSASATGNFNESPETRTKNVLKIYRQGQVGEDPAFEMRVEDIFARQSEHPKLQDGDVLVVESIQRRRFFTFRNISQVAGTIASVASLVFLVRD